ncbi:MAG TPA: tetratricopeptide repeat protein, partial [Candidatus Eisenbacteria bacterium]|nr:tetratricopeptide repeat protein [Candidatus Eisenbacteria bacterium]
PPPRTWRDPWAWAAALAVLPLLGRCAGAPLGEPVAEDFDFLHRARLEGMGTLLDGGGSHAFWRPVAHQLYYAALGGAIVAHPLAVALLHAALLAAAALLLYRALRPAWSGPLAAAAASFPLLAESTRTLIAWPSHFVDLGLYLFSALAVHEASRRRLASALAALAAALLCKEPAVAVAALLPLTPGAQPRRERLRWAGACAVLTLAWGAAYLAVRRHAHLELPHGLEHDPALRATPPLARLGWALGASTRAILSLPLVPDPRATPAFAAAGALLAAAALAAASPAARRRLVAARAWIAWGLAWFVFGTAALTPIYPIWQPNRSQFASVGLGVGLVAALGAAHPALAGGLVATRLALLALAPGPAASIAADPPATGAFMDFEHLTRLQRFMRETRGALRARFPTLPRGARVVETNLPHGLVYALGGDRALQVWYGDPTLRLLHFAEFDRDLAQPVAAVVQFQPHAPREIVLLPPDAVRAQQRGYRALVAGRYPEALAELARADSLEPDPAARVYRGDVAGLRAMTLARLGRWDEVEPTARTALGLNPDDPNARYVLAARLAQRGRFADAGRELDTLLAQNPGSRPARRIRAQLDSARAAPAPPR